MASNQQNQILLQNKEDEDFYYCKDDLVNSVFQAKPEAKKNQNVKFAPTVAKNQGDPDVQVENVDQEGSQDQVIRQDSYENDDEIVGDEGVAGKVEESKEETIPLS